ncbi:TonB-dependent receptor plug domain-containing protein [Sphingobium nicotianae]|nr:TonB-dependent receptor [Sphingobium nicotianae]
MAHDSLKHFFRVSSAAIALATVVHAAPAVAQQGDAAPAGDAASDAADRDIIVTGSRLGRTGYDAPTPVNVVGAERMNNLAISNVADALNQIPSFRAMSTPQMNSFRISGNIGARTLDLRGLGATRTLTLVDGRRFVASADNGTVDVNSIPSILVQRAEVVTGGASAAYGADAVAGVVNLILDSKLNGIKADMNSGISQRGDARTFYAGLAGGTDFAGGRGHVIAGIEYSREWGMGACEVRSWCAKYTNYVPNPGYNTTTKTSTNGLPATLVLDHVRFLYNENGILSGATKPNGTGGTTTLGQQVLNVGATSLPNALRNKQFDSNGNLVDYQIGSLLSGLFQQKEFDSTQPYLVGLSPTTLMVPTRHVSSMVHANYDLTDTIQLSGEFMYAHVVGGPAVSTPPLDGPATIDINNPYISAATRATILAADPAITKLLVNHSAVTSVGPSNVATTTIDTYRAAIGLKGEIGTGWNWDIYYTYGRVKSRIDDVNNRLKEWNNAIDAVRVTGANVGTSGLAIGSIVCRTTLTAPANGCIPINLFGPGGVSQAAAARYMVPEWQTRTYQQHVVALNLRGSPFSTWAGEVKVAIGGEYRRDTAVGYTDANTLAGNFISAQTTALPFTKTTVAEGYFEAGVPLLKDSALGKSLDVDGAIRFSHYEPFGDATTWKVGLVYTPVSELTFRVTRSRDVRAPTAQESSPNSTTIQLPLPDPFVGGNTNQFVVTGGNPNLHLERANTFTAGIVFRPSFIRGLNLSVDYYDIKVDGAIDSLTGPAITTACKNQNLLCNLIQFNPNGSVNTIFSNFQNLSQLHAEGLELVADYRFPAFGGDIDLQLNANYVIDLKTIGATGLVTQLDNWTGNNGSVTNIQGVPAYKIDGIMTYSIGDWAFTWHHRYVPKGILDPTKIAPGDAGYDINNPNSVNINYVSARYYLDFAAKVKIADTRMGGAFEVYGNINNVFDKGQPAQLRLIGNALHFDSIGRAFKIGIRATF